MHRWLMLFAITALLLQSSCATDSCYRTVTLDENHDFGFRLGKKLDLNELDRLVAKEPALSRSDIHNNTIFIQEAEGVYSVSFLDTGEEVYVNFHGPGGLPCGERVDLKPLYSVISRLPLPAAQRRRIRRHVRLRTVRTSSYPAYTF